MKKIVFIFIVTLFSVSVLNAQNKTEMKEESNKLAILWTSGDPDVFEKMVLMYTYNAKKQGWFDEVTFIIWGPSAKLLANTPKFQKGIKEMMDIGIKVEACIACARMYGVDQQLLELDIDVKGMGVPLSDYLKDGWKTLSL